MYPNGARQKAAESRALRRFPNPGERIVTARPRRRPAWVREML